MTRDDLRETLQTTNQFLRIRDGAQFNVKRVYANDKYEFLVEYCKLNSLTLAPGRKRTIDLVTFCRKYEPLSARKWK